MDIKSELVSNGQGRLPVWKGTLEMDWAKKKCEGKLWKKNNARKVEKGKAVGKRTVWKGFVRRRMEGIEDGKCTVGKPIRQEM